MFEEYKRYWDKINSANGILPLICGAVAVVCLFLCFSILWVEVIYDGLSVEEVFNVILYPLPLYAPHFVLFWLYVRGSKDA